MEFLLLSSDVLVRVEAHQKQHDDRERQAPRRSELTLRGEDLDWFRLNVFGFRKRIPEPSMSECWLWRGQVSDSGRPWMRVRGKRVGVARAAYATWVHPLRDDRGPKHPADVVRHGCGDFLCVNPRHLGTSRYPVSFDSVGFRDSEVMRRDSSVDSFS